MNVGICKNCKYIDLYLGGSCAKCGGAFVPLMDSAQWNVLSPQYKESFINIVIGMPESKDSEYYFDDEDEAATEATPEEVAVEKEEPVTEEQQVEKEEPVTEEQQVVAEELAKGVDAVAAPEEETVAVVEEPVVDKESVTVPEEPIATETVSEIAEEEDKLYTDEDLQSHTVSDENQPEDIDWLDEEDEEDIETVYEDLGEIADEYVSDISDEVQDAGEADVDVEQYEEELREAIRIEADDKANEPQVITRVVMDSEIEMEVGGRFRGKFFRKRRRPYY